MSSFTQSPHEKPFFYLPETQTPAEMIELSYLLHNFDLLLTLYALSGNQDTALGPDIERELDGYGTDMARLALTDRGFDLSVVKTGFGLFYNGMEEAAKAKFGPDRPTRFVEKLLQSLDIHKPTYRQRFAGLDETFFFVQFPKEFNAGTFPQRIDGESNEDYAGRFITSRLRGFPWATFSPIKDAK